MLWNSTSRPLLFLQRPIISGYYLLPILLGLVFFSCRLSQTLLSANTSSLGNSLLEIRYLLMTVVEFEIFFVLWLFISFFPYLARKGTLKEKKILAFRLCPHIKLLAKKVSYGYFGRGLVGRCFMLAFNVPAVRPFFFSRSNSLSISKQFYKRRRSHSISGDGYALNHFSWSFHFLFSR